MGNNFLDLVLNSLENREQVKYYISGQKLKLEYKDNKYCISSQNKKTQVSIKKQYKNSLIAVLFCLKMPTLNPRSIVVNFILNNELRAIQVTDIFSRNRIVKTEKITKSYLKNFPVVEYGNITLFSRIADFNYEYFNKLDFNEICDKDTINSVLCDVLFDKCKYVSERKVFKANLAEIGDKYKIGNSDGRIHRVY